VFARRLREDAALPPLAPVALRFARCTEPGGWTLSMITGAYALFLINTAWLHHSDLRRSYRLIIEHEALVADLSKAMHGRRQRTWPRASS
jgi:hypothetical protein